jgi:hypothetical protein
MISWFKAQYDELNPFGRFFFGLGVVSLAVAAGMTFKFGWSMSVLHALGLAVLSIVAGFLPEAAYRMSEEGKQGLGIVIAALAVPLLGVEYFSHVGYTVGQRVENVQQASVHNTKFEDTRDSLESDKANIAMWREHLSQLQAENAWVATVSPDGLKAQVAAADLAIKQEEARGGCGPKCLKLTKEKGDLENRIALAEQASNLTKQIEATQRIIDGKTTKAAEATFESSPVVNQTAFVAKMVGWSLKPNEAVQEGSQIGISASLALANVLLTPLCFLVAGRNRKAGAVSPDPVYRAGVEPRRSQPPIAAKPVLAAPKQTVIRVDDRGALEVLAGLKSRFDNAA